jgi:hypothetical protein
MNRVEWTVHEGRVAAGVAGVESGTLLEKTQPGGTVTCVVCGLEHDVGLCGDDSSARVRERRGVVPALVTSNVRASTTWTSATTTATIRSIRYRMIGGCVPFTTVCFTASYALVFVSPIESWTTGVARGLSSGTFGAEAIRRRWAMTLTMRRTTTKIY